MIRLPADYATKNGAVQSHGSAFELLLASELILRGGHVALSAGHFNPWDLICVSDCGKISKIDVKHANTWETRVIPGKPGFDALAIFSLGDWYICPEKSVRKKSISIGTIARFRDNWTLILPHNAEAKENKDS
jgi:hypothetical protein